MYRYVKSLLIHELRYNKNPFVPNDFYEQLKEGSDGKLTWNVWALVVQDFFNDGLLRVKITEDSYMNDKNELIQTRSVLFTKTPNLSY